MYSELRDWISSKMQIKLLDLKMGVTKPFEIVSCKGRIQNFFREGGTKFWYCLSLSFPSY